MFRLLGVHAGPDISAPAAARLAGVPQPRARRALAELAGAHLVAEAVPGRFGFHDLLRVYASELAQAASDEAERTVATRRVLDHYLSTANAAWAQARSWFGAELQVLLAACARAASAGLDTHAWQLPVALSEFLDRQGQWHDLAATQQSAFAAARRLGDRTGLARSRLLLGTASGEQGRYTQARRQTAHALALYRDLGHVAGQAHALTNLGWHHTLLGDYAAALGCCLRALELHRDLGNLLGEAHTWDYLGYVRDHLGEHDSAIICYHRALGLLSEVSDRPEQAGVLTRLGDAHRAVGDQPAAREAWQQALAVLDDLHHPDAAQVLSRLDDLAAAG